MRSIHLPDSSFLISPAAPEFSHILCAKALDQRTFSCHLWFQLSNTRGEGAVLRFIFAGIGGGIIVFGLVFFANNIKNSYMEED